MSECGVYFNLLNTETNEIMTVKEFVYLILLHDILHIFMVIYRKS